MEHAISSLRQLLGKSYPQILAAISMFAFVSTVTTVSNDPVSNGGSILVVIINFSTPLSPLTKRGSLTHSQALALSKRARDVTAPPVALNRYAIRLAGHQSPRQFFVRDGTAGGRLAKTIGCAGWAA